MNEKLEKLDRQKAAAEKKLIDYSGQLAHALKRVQRMGSAV